MAKTTALPTLFLFSFFLLLMGQHVLADIQNTNKNGQHLEVLTRKILGSELQLEARQTPLATVLDKLAHVTGATIHYSVLPEDLITATCVGSTLKQVLDCLFNHKADLIFRFLEQKNNAQPQAVEVWVLGSTLGKLDTKNCVLPVAHADIKQSEPTEVLLTLAKSSDPKQRAAAMGRLLAEGVKGDDRVKEVLEEGLQDKELAVRVQALSTYARREGAKAHQVLQTALLDPEVSIRLTAVNSAGADESLLQQALNDSEPTVRQLAALKLKQLLTTNETHW